MKTKLYSGLRIIISLSLIGLLLYLRRASLDQTLETINKLDPELFIFGCAFFFLSIIILAARFKLLLDAQGLSLRFFEVIHLTFIGYFFNNFLPTAIGGDVVKAYYTSKKTDNKLASFITVFMDRLIGLLGLFILAGVSLILTYKLIKTKLLIWPIAIILFLLLFIFAVLLNKKLAALFSGFVRLIEYLKIKEKLQRVYNAINTYKDKKTVILLSLLISIVAQITSFYVIYLLSKGMGVAIPVKMVLLFMPLVIVVSMLPSINGLGIRESAIYFLFGPYVGYKNALALSLLWLFMLLLVSIIGGISYLSGAQYKIKNIEKEGS